MENVYFDNAATTRLDEDVLKEMMPYLINKYGNASSIYKLGRESRKAVGRWVVISFVSGVYSMMNNFMYVNVAGVVSMPVCQN